ncbi:MAG: hypothetical protein MUO52_08460 [Desulfobacterales bacterium]|nr:hypothetical protein [Desulfobacterales bacterium]
MSEVRIDQGIFKDHPTFRRGIVVATNLQNQAHSKELEELLHKTVAELGKRPIDLKADPRIVAWDEAHRKFGSNPNKYPPAHSALIKRAQKAGTRIPFINKVVAIMNCNSIADVGPVGGDDVDRAGDCLELRYASGSEVFVPLGSPETIEHPLPGEIIYTVGESGEVMCRRWNWRNGHKTRITEETRNIVMNVDGLGEESEERTLATRDRVAGMLEAYCQAHIVTALLSPTQPSYRF